jgi:hypothetical protein
MKDQVLHPEVIIVLHILSLIISERRSEYEDDSENLKSHKKIRIQSTFPKSILLWSLSYCFNILLLYQSQSDYSDHLQRI